LEKLPINQGSRFYYMSNKYPNIAIFASGSGSNFQAIVDAVNQNKLQAHVALLVCDQPNAFVIERAKKLQIDTFIFQSQNYPSKEAFELEIVEQLQQKNVELIVLAGYMRIIGNTLLTHFPNKIINIHPALLPSFPGAHGIRDAFEFGVKVFGVTVHNVDAGVDTGTIIDQESFHFSEGMTCEDVENEIHRIEHQIYPKVIQKILHS
jgi:phosphoribosylglycinamide formyltransferase 1